MIEEKVLPPLYELHKGTLKISGSTIPWKAANCAIRYLEDGFLPIDFLYVGGNAGNQAIKAISTFVYLVSTKYPTMEVVFAPMVFTTQTKNPSTGEELLKTCTVLRVRLLTSE